MMAILGGSPRSPESDYLLANRKSSSSVIHVFDKESTGSCAYA